ncbi:cop9 signalosome subunit 7 [Grosmannia clavigera kw1407]|uniref:Cop9 signalosome subunit 7 n=1 Tax=Grosmannia clavigera (strain kw1407 / UAMH 11150) TaxID=655863 RepID=F0XT40_GROCL|nr:cop9 signalosome subunit 7 [Grosmannia clavigera kw1407]EFW99333.1 cop9 signalosome subunit 7 [Grosmannia clavigera kw1407]
MAQVKALDALEPFVALAKSATSSRAAVDLVVRATSHPGTYIFAELLQTPEVQALANANPEHAVYLTLLQIFSYGTYADYERGSLPSSFSPDSEAATTTPSAPLPPLSETQASKLRQLSLISLATDRASLAYAHLVTELRLTSARELETLVMTAVYAGLVSATLDPAREVVRISSVSPLRDLAPGAVPKLRAALQTWSGRCEATLADLDAQIAAIRRAAVAKAEEERRWDARFNNALDDERAKMKQSDLMGSSQLGAGGGVSAFLSGGSSSASTYGKKAMTLNMSNSSGPRGKPRFMKRSSNLMTDNGSNGAAGNSTDTAGALSGSAAADDDEGMDLDDEDGDTEANKRASRRKL